MNWCFLPTTKIQLVNDDIVEMQYVNPGDILKSGSVVRAVMKVNNRENQSFYKFSNGVDETPVYVTGSHTVMDNNGNFIPVKDHPDAILDESVEQPKFFSCLITSDHKIQIGKNVFWDWEDYRLEK